MSEEVKSLTTKGSDTNLIDRIGYLPDEAYVRYGCSTCEWRCIKKECPNTNESSGEFTAHPDNICEKRILFLARNTPFYDKKPSLDEWMLDVNKSIGHARVFSEVNTEKMLAQMLQEANSSNADPRLIESLQLRLDRQKSFTLYWWKETTKFLDAKIGRETTKKIDVRGSISPSQFQNMIRDIDEDNIVDVEFDSIESLRDEKNE